ncbi:biotin-dependent carboxyltransferase family protein [Alkalihalobacillus sp. TS-13]|uniref:5-oxoprolinase subunit C family protein n=1 Tax=Alkalihalobacillus sp. TS-13 TaxID=2842455 RepID=UPI00289302F8|nr:biotin-dependent carboxyltransferase family protein [Alkalihalobacillus sp. TS-13]
MIEPGFIATIQDGGRNGYYHLGVPPCGAADKLSFQIGNLLLGNPPFSAGLEITLAGPTVVFEKSTVITVTGAPANVTLNGKQMAMWEVFKVKKGDALSISYSTEAIGVFTYMCVSGGITVPEILGSRSTYTLGDFGGFLSRKLENGDAVPISEPLPGAFNRVGKSVENPYIPSFSNKVDVHAVMGVSGNEISDEGITKFLNNEWEVKLESNRVAYRFDGETIPYKDYEPPFGSGNSAGGVVDFAYPIGAILVPNTEEVILLLNDATVGGGFVMAGTVISPDLSYLAQARPGSSVRFHAVTVQQATQLRLEQKKQLNDLVEQLQ